MSNFASSIQTFRQEWQTRWAAMASRERQIATIAIWLIVVTFLVLVCIRPAFRTLSDAPEKIRQIDVQLDEMRRLADEVQVLRQRQPVPPAQAEAALKAATERLADTARLTIQGDRATLTLTKVDGEALAAWLEEARSGARIKPVEAALMQVQPGVYSGTLIVALGLGSGGGL
jgi:general secretion pathway protein M